jgi:hypothetical protein
VVRAHHLLRVLSAGLRLRDPGQPGDLGDAAPAGDAQEGLVRLKAWVKSALDRAIQECMNQPALEFIWVGDDAVDPLQQAQTLIISHPPAESPGTPGVSGPENKIRTFS